MPAYAGLVLMLRASGKRTLSKMNAFDLIVTVALGSTLASTLLGKTGAVARWPAGAGPAHRPAIRDYLAFGALYRG